MRRREYNRICLSKFEDLSAQNCERKKKDHVIDKEDENDNPLYYLFISPLCNQNVLFRCNLWSSLLISENISYHWFPKE